jgi:hypothetical protein
MEKGVLPLCESEYISIIDFLLNVLNPNAWFSIINLSETILTVYQQTKYFDQEEAFYVTIVALQYKMNFRNMVFDLKM